MNLTEARCEDVTGSDFSRQGSLAGYCERDNEISGVRKGRYFLDQLTKYQRVKNTALCAISMLLSLNQPLLISVYRLFRVKA
jgi:hypothetical protein